MRLRFSLLALAILLAALTGSRAEAKSPAYVISGGNLGPYAAHVWSDIQLPGPDAVVADTLENPPSLAYDLFTSWGNFAVPEQMATGGAEFTYYPESQLLYHRYPDRWYQPVPRR
jgi:hypothetical protein